MHSFVNVSIHAPARGATWASETGRLHANVVSIHAPARGATGASGSTSSPIRDRFQSTPPREGRLTDEQKTELQKLMFQSTPPREGRHPGIDAGSNVPDRFNPRPRARGDDTIQGKIEALVPFQSTPPREGRPGMTGRPAQEAVVSIHAPARGATSWKKRMRCRCCRFNPRPRARGDLTPSVSCPRSDSWFQSTPPREGRPGHPAHLADDRGRFNPRPRARGDAVARALLPGCTRFNPRPRARGDSATSWTTRACRERFNPRPRARGDSRSRSTSIILAMVFQSTPPREGRHARARYGGGTVVLVSIHAPARGATCPRRAG